MKDDIKLPPMFMPGPRGYDPDEIRAYARAAVEADRQHIAHARKMVPSDDDIHTLWREMRPSFEWRSFSVRLIRTALDRYGSSQPATTTAAPSDEDLLGCAGITRHHAGGMPMIIGTADIRRFADCVRKHWGQPAASAEPPDGYAYRYPDGIRFNDGREVNGCKPTETLPYWFGAAPVAQEPVAEICGRRGERALYWCVSDPFRYPDGTKLYTPPVAAQAQPSAQDREDAEHILALKEAGCNAASDSYFSARPSLPETIETRILFEDGFDRGYDAARAAKEE
ncbi:hypothetical protein [Castellaniella sp. UC4442_H9]